MPYTENSNNNNNNLKVEERVTENWKEERKKKVREARKGGRCGQGTK